MSRVVIIDYFGGGKTTLANQLGNLLEILNEMEENQIYIIQSTKEIKEFLFYGN